jgi:proteasome accessory factor C
MLVIVPYLIRHPGTSLDQAAELFDVPAVQLRKDLDLLFLSGLPPYGPGDLIDVEIDERDGIWISMADHFSRPLQLTRQEALALELRGAELAATPGVPQAPALSAALAKLREALAAHHGDHPDGAIDAAPMGQPPPLLQQIREAAQEHRRIQIEYFATSTNTWSNRVIEPEEVFVSLGRWYVSAWDVGASAERLFRADRVRQVKRTEEFFSPRGLEGAGRPLYTPTESDVDVRLRLGPAARWIAEYYETSEETELPEGVLEVVLPTSQLGWIARLLLRVWPDVLLVEPPELRDLALDLARDSLALYEQG